MNFVKGFKPSYYDNFYCIGKNCKYTCCKRWSISVKEYEMEKWKNTAPDVFKLYDENTSTTKINDKNMLNIDLNEEGVCPFLDEEGLCSLQKKYGPEALSAVCMNFPRKIVDHGDMVEMHLSPGCEKVVQQFIKEKQGIKLINYKIKNATYTRLAKDKKREEERAIFNYYYDIKVLLLSILQNRDYTIEERMLILGIAMKKLDEMEKQNRINEIPIFVDVFLESIEEQDITKKLRDFTCNETIQMLHNFVNMQMTMLKKEFNSFDEFIEKIKDRITPNYDDELVLSETKKMTYMSLATSRKYEFDEKDYSLRKYKEAIQEYKEFIKDKEYYIENYLVTWILYKDIPFSNDTADIWDEYCYFAIMYSMYRFILTCCLNKNSHDDEFIDCTVRFSRGIIHTHDDHLKELILSLKEKEKNNLDYIAIMLLQEN